MKTASELLCALIKCYLRSEEPSFDISDEELKAVWQLAHRHDVEHLVGLALMSKKPNSSEMFFKSQMKALMRSEQQSFERSRIYELFEKEGIDYMPLKGSVIRDIYPETWHRTSCDIDILVRVEELDRATALLADTLGYEVQGKSEHDVSIMAQRHVHFELHYDFHARAVTTDEIWEWSSPVDGTHMYKMPPEIFVYCHIAHMAKHFRNGGCGFRGFIDLYMIEQKMEYDREKLRALLEEKGLKKFSESAFALVAYWFGDGEKTDFLSKMSEYIIDAGAYGSIKNQVAIKRARQGKLRYIWSRIFIPREALKYRYPVLERYPILLPVCQVRRWFDLALGGRLGKAKRELTFNSQMDDAYRNSVNSMIKELEI